MNYTPYENKCFNPRNQNHRVVFVTRVNFVCVQMRHTIRGLQFALNTQLLRVITERAIYQGVVMDGQSFGQNQMKFHVDMLNHATD